MKKLISLVLMGLLCACNTTAPQNIQASDYENDFNYPNNTDSLILVEQKIYDEPLYGTSVRYANKYFEQDNILLFTYPIRNYVWHENINEILAVEMNNALNDIDNAIDQGMYLERFGNQIDDFSFNQQGKYYSGLRSQTKIVLKSGTQYQSYTYLFAQKDKFVKFSISLPFATNLPAPDHFIREVLPNLSVPDESGYMANLRKMHKQEYNNN